MAARLLSGPAQEGLSKVAAMAVLVIATRVAAVPALRVRWALVVWVLVLAAPLSDLAAGQVAPGTPILFLQRLDR